MKIIITHIQGSRAGNKDEFDGPVVRIGNVPIRVEVADTPELRTKGLSGRSSLGATNGMLFIFDKSDYHKIWMKDMHIMIDVMWIDENFTVIDITRGLRPDSYPKTFEPHFPARFVIESPMFTEL